MPNITILFFNVKLIQGQIGLNSVHMVMELIRDNRKIVDRISHEHIDKFVGLLQRDKVCSDLTSNVYCSNHSHHDFMKNVVFT